MATKKNNLKVNITADNSGFTKGLDNATRSLKGFDQQAGQLVGATIKKFASLTTAIAATVKVLNDIKDSTQLWGDRWTQTMEGMKSSYGTLIRQLSSGEGWNNLLANMSDAYRTGKQLASMLDEVFERKISFSYAEAEANRVISEQQLIMRDLSKSDAERAAAAEEIKKQEANIVEIKKSVWGQEAQVRRDQFRDATRLEGLNRKMNDEEIDFLVKNYNTNRDIINQSRAYLEEKARLTKEANASTMVGMGGDYTPQGIDSRAAAAAAALERLDANTNQTIKDVARLVTAYDKGNDELVKNLADAEIAFINIDTEANRAVTRATSFLGSLESKAKSAKTAVQDLGETLRTVQDLGWGSTFNDIDLAAAWEKLPVLEGNAVRMNSGNQLAGSRPTGEIKKDLVDIDRLSEQAASTIQNSLVGAFEELANVLGGVESGLTGVVTALISPLADLAITAGTIILTTGEALDALKNSLIDFFGGNAVAAGAALIGVGVAAKAGLAALGKNAGAGYSSATSVASSGGGYGSAGGDATLRSVNVNVNGRLEADGSKLVAVINNTTKKKGYTT